MASTEDNEDTRDVRISVRNLWKIFGADAANVRQEEWVPTASRKEIQERTGHVIAVKDTSFDVQEGEVFVVMGLSGSGKSTLVRCLIRLIEPTSGSIMIDGQEAMTLDNKQLIELRRSKIGMIFQHYGLLPHRRVIDNVAYGLEVKGIKKHERYERAEEVLETVGLTDWLQAYPDELSGGMQQRVGIARALALDPPILLMDEPFSGLDPLIRREMQDELISLQEQVQKTIVFVTHDLNEALKLGSRIAIMRDGEIIQIGSPEEIVTVPVDAYVTEFVRDVSRAKVLGAASIMQQPEAVVYEWQGPRVAMHVMQSNDVDYAFVLGRNRILKDVISLEEANQAVRDGIGALRDVANNDCPKCEPETLVEELVPLAAEYEYPIAVVDEKGELLGEVHRAAILRSMSSVVAKSENSSEAEQDEATEDAAEPEPVGER